MTTRRWIHRITAKEIKRCAEETNKSVMNSWYEYVAAWRYWEAIEHWFQDNHATAYELASKVRTDKFMAEPQKLMRARAHIANTYKQEDPFVEIRIAAHQQRMDWEKLVNGHTPEQLDRIRQRHELYRLAQPELNNDA